SGDWSSDVCSSDLHDRVIVIERVVYEDRRTAEIGTNARPILAATVKADAGDRVESHRDALDWRKPWVQTRRVRELISTLCVVIKQVIVTPAEADPKGIQHRGTYNMCF